MDEDFEIEAIKRRKLAEIMKKMSQGQNSNPHFPNSPVVVTDDSFDEFLSRYPVVVVDFWADWCGPCKMIAPMVEELARKYAGRVVFGKLNVDENPSTPQRFSVFSIPTLLVFKQGKLVDSVVGAGYPRSYLEKIIDKHLT